MAAAKPRLKRIAICTGGGDAPGLNAVIRAVVVAAHRQGWEVVGIREGYSGLLEPQGERDLVEAPPGGRGGHHPPGRHHPRHHQPGQSRSSTP